MRRLKAIGVVMLIGVLGGITGIILGVAAPHFFAHIDMFAWGAYGAVSGLAFGELAE